MSPETVEPVATSDLGPEARKTIFYFLERVEKEYEQVLCPRPPHRHPWLITDEHSIRHLKEAYQNLTDECGHTGPIEREIEHVLCDAEAALQRGQKTDSILPIAGSGISALRLINQSLTNEHEKKIHEIIEQRKQQELEKYTGGSITYGSTVGTPKSLLQEVVPRIHYRPQSR
jgi:hypothetical protein